MESMRNCSSVPPELAQGWYRDNWFNSADFAQRSGGSPHSPHEMRPPLGGFPAPGMGPIGGMVAAAVAKHAAGDYKTNPDDDFKRHVVAMLMQRETEMRIVMHQSEQLHLKFEALSIELVKMKTALHDERRMREEMMNVMVVKEKLEKEERVRREAEEAKKMEELVWNQQEDSKRLQETINRIEKAQLAMREHVERIYDEDEQKKRQEENMRAELLTKEMIKREEEEEQGRDETEKKEAEEKMMMANMATPSSGVASPAKLTSSSRGSAGPTCFNCHQDGHYARDCVDLDVECDLCGGVGHSSDNCVPSRRCYNCNKTGHRHYECKEVGTRRCFHCRKVGHLAINCKNAPKQ